jgi:hypothetical protein
VAHKPSRTLGAELRGGVRAFVCHGTTIILIDLKKKITVNVESKSKIVTHKLLFIKVTTVMM